MDDKAMIKIKCPHCDKEWGVSLNTFDYVESVKIECYDGQLLVKLDKKTKTLIIEQVV